MSDLAKGLHGAGLVAAVLWAVAPVDRAPAYVYVCKFRFFRAKPEAPGELKARLDYEKAAEAAMRLVAADAARSWTSVLPFRQNVQVTMSSYYPGIDVGEAVVAREVEEHGCPVIADQLDRLEM